MRIASTAAQPSFDRVIAQRIREAAKAALEGKEVIFVIHRECDQFKLVWRHPVRGQGPKSHVISNGSMAQLQALMADAQREFARLVANGLTETEQ